MSKRFNFLLAFFVSLIFWVESKEVLYGKESLTLVALGDSTTAGTPAFFSPAERPPSGAGNRESQYAYWLQKRYPEWQIFNRGIHGERSDQILKRFDSDVIPFKPDVVIVLAGINDLYQGYSADWIEKNLRSIYERAAKENIKVMVCTILPYNSSTPEVRRNMQEVNGWIRRYSQEHHLGFCDTFHFVEDGSHPGNLISTADGLHPDVAGYHKMGDALADAFETWLLTSRSGGNRDSTK